MTIIITNHEAYYFKKHIQWKDKYACNQARGNIDPDKIARTPEEVSCKLCKSIAKREKWFE